MTEDAMRARARLFRAMAEDAGRQQLWGAQAAYLRATSQLLEKLIADGRRGRAA